jgi:hypothetical protein
LSFVIVFGACLSWFVLISEFVTFVSPLGLNVSVQTWYIYYWQVHFVNNVITIKSKAPLFLVYVTLVFFGLVILYLVFLLAKTFKLFNFPIFDLGRTWWRLFQKHVMRIKLDVHLRLNLLRMRNNDRVNQIYWTLSVFFIGTLFFLYIYSVYCDEGTFSGAM